MLEPKDYSNLVEDIAHPFHFLWQSILNLASKNKYPDLNSFEGRKKIFLWILKKLLDEGKLKIGKNGRI
jgi:hypothetical protein